MHAGVIQFPGSNCDRDMALAFGKISGTNKPAKLIWHKQSTLPKGLDIIAIPGGFSFGDYLRCGAIAACSPIMQAVVDFANSGGYVIGVCNGFQILTECGLLPGVLMRNKGLKFISTAVDLQVTTSSSIFTHCYHKDQRITIPIAHHDGNYTANIDTLHHLEQEDRIAFRYVDNPNGSANDIAGILSQNRRVLGMMPHPERMNDPYLGGTDGSTLFQSIAETITLKVI